MGYVDNNFIDDIINGGNLTISWTKIGREYLIGKKKNRKAGLTIIYFAVSDVDTNYKILTRADLIPNITGEEGFCINGNLRDNMFYLINYKNLITTNIIPVIQIKTSSGGEFVDGEFDLTNFVQPLI